MKREDLEGLQQDVASLKQLLRRSVAAQHGLATIDVEFDDREMRARPRQGAKPQRWGVQAR